MLKIPLLVPLRKRKIVIYSNAFRASERYLPLLSNNEGKEKKKVKWRLMKQNQLTMQLKVIRWDTQLKELGSFGRLLKQEDSSVWIIQS